MFGTTKGTLKIRLTNYLGKRDATNAMSTEALTHLSQSKFNRIAIDFKDQDIPMDLYKGLIMNIVKNIGYANFKYKVTFLNVKDVMTKVQVKTVMREARYLK